MVVIGLVGNPFSPAYARSRAADIHAEPLSFCSLNVALRGPRHSAWCLTERAISPRDREADAIAIGSSTMQWIGDRLVIRVDERTTPLFGVGRRPVRGTIVFTPEGFTGKALSLDGTEAVARHTWWPVAPRGHIDVNLAEPDLAFSGTAYHDANAGSVPLEDSFEEWSWARGSDARGDAVVTYDTALLGGGRVTHAFRWDGAVAHDLAPPPSRVLSTSPWGIRRVVPAEKGATPKLVRALEDTPFYARSLVDTRLHGEPIRLVHETLDARRLGRRWVRALLGYKMGRP